MLQSGAWESVRRRNIPSCCRPIDVSYPDDQTSDCRSGVTSNRVTSPAGQTLGTTMTPEPLVQQVQHQNSRIGIASQELSTGGAPAKTPGITNRFYQLLARSTRALTFTKNHDRRTASELFSDTPLTRFLPPA